MRLSIPVLAIAIVPLFQTVMWVWMLLRNSDVPSLRRGTGCWFGP